MQVPLVNDTWDTVKALSGAGERPHRFRDMILSSETTVMSRRMAPPTRW